MHTIHLVIGFGWLVFWIGWLAAAVNVKSGRTHFRRYAGFRLVIAVVVVSLLRLPAFRGHVSRGPLLAGIGLALFVAGLAVAVWARIYLGRNWGAPMSEKDDPQLVTTGPYRFVRNPIYSGIILAMVGTAIAVSFQWLFFAGAAAGYFVYSAFVEQRYLAAQFPDTFPKYRRATKMLIPFVF